MRKTRLIAFLLVIFLPLWNLDATARSVAASDAEPISGSVVCPPGLYISVPSDCLPLGPSGFLSQSSAQGLPYPILPLPAYSPDRALTNLPYQYFKVTDAGAPLFSSLDDAIAHQPSKVLYPSNHLYVSYLGDAVETSQGSFYQLRSGYWVFAEGGRLGRYDPPFQGLVFSSTPHNAFGWVRIPGGTQSRTAPGLNSPESKNTSYRQVVQIYATQKTDNLTWDLVGPGEWINDYQISRVDPNPIAPAGVDGNRWISVNLFEQTVTVYENNHLIFATMASTGVDRFWTRPGLFHIQKKLESTTMSNSVQDDFYYLEDVPWTLYFDEGRALHGAYWHNNFGYQLSHGCVNLSPGDAHWLYDWASEGDFVYVYDPSGQTPTDPLLFGSSGY
jgi:lipoprotein-anchoring transpeptidase ErfK/SrfK